MSEELGVYGLSECLPMSAQRRIDDLPRYAALLCLHADVIEDYGRRKDAVMLRLGQNYYGPIHRSDYELARKWANEVWGKGGSLKSQYAPSALEVLEIESRCRVLCRRDAEAHEGRRAIAMLRNDGSSGYWRMVVPARFVDRGRFRPDVSLSRNVGASALDGYSTVMVQMVYDWESYYVLEQLQRAGKRIVYDFDDDIFNLPPTHYLRQVIGNDQYQAALECMRLADAVTCTTEHLREVLVGKGIAADKIHVIPNAMDLSGFPSVEEIRSTNMSPHRLFWSGSSTHVDDWTEDCLLALDGIFARRKDVVLTVMGYLPPSVRKRAVESPVWRDRVEYVPFGRPDAYFSALRFVRASVGIMPLANTLFNAARSHIKFLEFTMAGMPVVASDVAPYNDIIEDGRTGLLADTAEEWVKYIGQCLDDREAALACLAQAREVCSTQFDIRKVVKMWERVLSV